MKENPNLNPNSDPNPNPNSNPLNPNQKSRFRGAMLGLAIGDALGMPVEGMTSEEITEKFGRVEDFMPGDNNKPGEWTDDTQEALLLAESIIETVYLSPERFSAKLISAMAQGKLLKAGPTTRRAIFNLQSGIPWTKSGVDADTCGAAMRVAPIGLVYNLNLELVEKYTYISSIVTHKGASAIAGAIAVTLMIAHICRNREKFGFKSSLDSVLSSTDKYDPLISDKIKSGKLEGVSMLTWDVVPAAFYHFQKTESFEECVLNAVNKGGDTDSIAAIAGAMKGAKVGMEKIPEEWISQLKDSEYILGIADQLYELHLNFKEFY